MDRRKIIIRKSLFYLIPAIIVFVALGVMTCFLNYNLFFPSNINDEYTIQDTKPYSPYLFKRERCYFNAVEVIDKNFEKSGKFILADKYNNIMLVYIDNDFTVKKLESISLDNPLKLRTTQYIFDNEVEKNYEYLKKTYPDYKIAKKIFMEESFIDDIGYTGLLSLIAVLISMLSIFISSIYKPVHNLRNVLNFLRKNTSVNTRRADTTINKNIEVIGDYIIVSSYLPNVIDLSKNKTLKILFNRWYSYPYSIEYWDVEGKSAKSILYGISKNDDDLREFKNFLIGKGKTIL